MVWQTVKAWEVQERVGNFTHQIPNSAKHGRWPDPFRNAIKKIDVLACEDTWMAEFEMWTLTIADFFWSHLVPGPFEIIRKTATGGYKCGFYFGSKWRSPIDIIWRDARTSRALGQIVRPVTTGFFYVWAAGSAIDALNTWHSLQLKQEMCEANGNETILRDASGHLITGHNEGAPVFSTVVYDPQNRATPTSTIVQFTDPCEYVAYAYGYIESQSAEVTNCRVKVDATQSPDAWFDVPDTPSFGVTAWEANVRGSGPSVVIQPQFECDVGPGGIFKARVICTRLIVTIVPVSFPIPHDNLIGPGTDKPHEFCEAFEPPYV